MASDITTRPIGLYLHIPFCESLCHYCDFVKTAWHDTSERDAYLAALAERVQSFLANWSAFSSLPRRLSSVFLGGGTPSVFTEEYASLFAEFQSFLTADTELTLEVNPEHVTEKSLEIWRSLGINRLSIGIQSFDEGGLKTLTRSCAAEQAKAAIEMACARIPNVSIDLIYAWPGQTYAMWMNDVEQALSLPIQHLSLYGLTYEGRTPFARRRDRGVIQALADETQELYYQGCRRLLAEMGWRHEEVSNWAKPGFEAIHNSIYWQGGTYLGIGAGAHSYFEELGPFGLRCAQGPRWKKFKPGQHPKDLNFAQLLALPEYEVESGRDAEAWIFETVSSGLRTQKGINLDAICAKSGYDWAPCGPVQRALAEGLILIDEDSQCRLVPEEWYRETRWALEVALCFERER